MELLGGVPKTDPFIKYRIEFDEESMINNN
jgi:hypothetical protein